MPANYPLSVCERCHGFGVLAENDTRLTCLACRGRGVTGRLDELTTTALLPVSVERGATARSLLWNKLRPLIFWSILILVVGLGARLWSAPLAAEVPTQPGQLGESRVAVSAPMWQKLTEPTDGLHLLWWLAITALLFAWFYRSYGEEPPHSLEALRDGLKQRERHPGAIHLEKDGALDIIPYFSQAALSSLDQALILTERTKNSVLTPHILLASLLCGGKTAVIVSRLEQDAAAACKLSLGRLTRGTRPTAVSFAPETRALILEAFMEAYENGFATVDVEDFLLAIAKNPGELAPTITELGLSYDKVRAVARYMNEELETIRRWQFWRQKGRLRPKGYMNRAWTALPTPFLDRYSRDFTQLAAIGQLPIVKVRDREIDEAIRILAGSERNNALIVGQPGVGKTSIIGAIAARMVEERVPEPLKDKRLIELDLSALVAGGQNEQQNMERLLTEVKNAGNVILFIGHVETLVNKQGGLSAAALLEAASKSSQLQLIGTATFADYHRYIESNPSFANSFQKVEIDEVSDENAITIIEEESPKIQTKYKVLLTYPAIREAVLLSRRLLPDRVLPEKALDVLADAAQLAGSRNLRTVTQALVQEVLTNRSGVPVSDLATDERGKLLALADTMRQRVIGQDEAVNKVAEALRRARTGLKDPNRPIGAFLFVGPTGVGKTETARTLAGSYFGSRDAMTRLDMSEYQDAKAVYQLIGAPAASAGEFTEGGELTRAVREQPYSLILLDEIEKAHPDVLNIFLQLLDDGRLTENTGRTVPFTNTIIIATSNAGAAQIVRFIEEGITADDLAVKTESLLQQSFKPEFLNRFDAVVAFRPLSPEHVRTIATIMLSEVAARLKEQEVEATFSNDVVEFVSRAGFDRKYGARPLRRAIADHVETRLADLLLTDKIKKREKLIITAAMLGLEPTAATHQPPPEV